MPYAGWGRGVGKRGGGERRGGGGDGGGGYTHRVELLHTRLNSFILD